MPALIPVLFYMIGYMPKVGYFGHRWLAYQHAAVLVPLIALLAIRLPRWLGLVLPLTVYGAAVYLGVKSLSARAPVEAVRRESPIGPIYTAPQEPNSITLEWVRQWTGAHPADPFLVLSGWAHGGWYAFFDRPNPVRNSLFARNTQTPQELEQLREILPRIALLLVQLEFRQRAPTVKGIEDGLLALRFQLTQTLPVDISEQILREFELRSAVGNWVILERRRDPLPAIPTHTPGSPPPLTERQ